MRLSVCHTARCTERNRTPFFLFCGRSRIHTSAEGEWRNWQTRRIQDPVGFKTRGGSSPPSPTKAR